MKRKILYNSLILLFALILAGCENTNENLVQQRGVAVSPAITKVEPAFFTTDFDNSYIQFDVSLPEGEKVDASELQVNFNDKTATMQQITSYPTTIKLPIRDVMNKLGLTDNDVDVEKNNEFNFQVLTSSNGVMTRSKSGTLKAMVTCEFDPAMAVGSYHVVSGSWEVEGDVTFTADPNDPYKIYVSGIYEMEGGTPNDNLLELNINPTSFEVTGPQSKLGPSTPWGKYTNYYYQPVQGIYRSCTGTFEIQFKITVDEGGFGNFDFTFTKN